MNSPFKFKLDFRQLTLIRPSNKVVYMCSIQMSPKYILGIGLIVSSLEIKHLGLIQSRVREGAQKGVNEVYFIKTYVLGHLNQVHRANLTPTASIIK